MLQYEHGKRETEGLFMEKMTFGTTDIEVTRIVLGTWAMGGWLWGGSDAADAVRSIHEALDIGITTIDTAPVYGFGASEELVAKALATAGVGRDKVVLATKAGLDWDKDENTFRNSKPERIREEVEQSLRRLQTDYIDIYQIHWPDEDTPIEETADVMGKLLEEGKVRALGVCNYSTEQMDAWRRVAPLHSNQVRFNLIERQTEQDILPYCKEHNLGFMAYSPLARGLLTGKYDANAVFPEGDSRGGDPRFTGDGLQRNVRIVQALTRLAEEAGKTVAQLAVRWTLDRDDSVMSLWGARRPGQIAPAAGLSGWKLSSADMELIDAIVNEA